MDSVITLIIFIVIIFIASIIGAFLPFLFKLNDKQLHLMIAFSAGIFLGILFLSLIPEAFYVSIQEGLDYMDVVYLMLFGFLIIFIIDFLVKHYSKPECGCEDCEDDRSHDITSMSTFLGLSIHSIFDGLLLGFAFMADDPHTEIIILIGLCIHKTVILFSLSSTFLMSNRKKDAMKYLITFCLISPIATIFSFVFLNGVELDYIGLGLALSAGIFMFVTMWDILPEAFHRKNLNISSIIMLLLGLIVIIVVTQLFGHAH